MRSVLSKKNKYRIPAFRFLELKNWVRQYPDWEKERKELLYLRSTRPNEVKSSYTPDPTGDIALRLTRLNEKIYLVKSTSIYVCDGEDMCATLLRTAVTQGLSYDAMIASHPQWMLPSRRDWYIAYRKFFYILDLKRD